MHPLQRLLQRRDDEADALRAALAASEATTARLWGVVDGLEARAAAAAGAQYSSTFRLNVSHV